MQALRQIEATIDSVVTVLSNSIPGFAIASSSAADPQVSRGSPSFNSSFLKNLLCCQLKLCQSHFCFTNVILHKGLIML